MYQKSVSFPTLLFWAWKCRRWKFTSDTLTLSPEARPLTNFNSRQNACERGQRPSNASLTLTAEPTLGLWILGRKERLPSPDMKTPRHGVTSTGLASGKMG
uniref:Secreted protein n=1 Tax=Panagrellus redivivus TaxID=6233 RepID=A0A7E5A1N9_PANRE